MGSACGGSSSSEVEALEEQIAGLQEQIAVLGEQLDATPTLRDGSGASLTAFRRIRGPVSAIISNSHHVDVT